MEIVVASGKGGTGKTFVASNLAYFLIGRGILTVCVDADAEAPDLLLALGGVRKNISILEISRSRKARINYDKCSLCMKCLETCNFNAISIIGGKPVVNDVYCEGCGACSFVCPANAIKYDVKKTGVIRVDISGFRIPVVTADLEVGGRNTGELVYLAKEKAHEVGHHLGAKLIVVDAAAGIGCPVISSLAGADVLLVVAEPTPQSFMGARRLLETASGFNLKTFVIVNKCDLNPGFMKKFLEDLDAEVLGNIPYDYSVVKAYTQMTPILAYRPSSKVSRTLSSLFSKFIKKVMT